MLGDNGWNAMPTQEGRQRKRRRPRAEATEGSGLGVPLALAGSGKTSLVTALAGALALDVYVVTLSSPAMTDETLRQLLNNAEAK